MNITGKIQSIKVPENIVNTKTSVSESCQWSLKEAGKATAEELSLALTQLKQQLANYLPKLQADYTAFLAANRLKRQVANLPKKTDDQSVPQKIASISYSRFNNQRKATLRFIATMEEGYALLHYIRQQVTGQTLTTKFTVHINNHIYVVDSSLIKDLYKPVLSTFGGTSGSPFSLAYQLNIERFQEAIIEGRKGIEDITENDIYTAIMKVKIPYLATLSALRGRKYRPVFNSKDAEIFDYMVQSHLSPDWLVEDKYAKLRASMGGGGGYRTSGIKLGDVGLQQDKFFSQKNSTVNFARYSLIQNNLNNLFNTLTRTSNPEILTQAFIKMFTERGEFINEEDQVSLVINQEAQEHIRELFSILTY